MRSYKLTEEEKAILRAFEQGEFKPVRGGKKMLALLRTRHPIMVDLPVGDLKKLEAKAESRGISREKLASDVLHQYSSL